MEDDGDDDNNVCDEVGDNVTVDPNDAILVLLYDNNGEIG